MSYRRRRANKSGDSVPNDVKGPSSALTSFLKEQGINAEAIRLKYEENLKKEQEDLIKPIERDESDDIKIELSTNNNEIDSDEEELPNGEDLDSIKLKKRKLNEYDHISSIDTASNNGDNQKIYCLECDRKFMVNVYSKKTEKYGKKGYLCQSCTKIQLRKDKLSKRIEIEEKKRRKKIAAALLDKKQIILPSLQDFCIKLITDNIDQIDNLNDEIGYHNKEKICKILSKNRSLNNKTIDLFLKSDTTELEFWDCSKIDKNSLDRIPAYCPKLEKLTLNMCGQFHNDNLTYYGKKMENLKHLSLNGPFLINDNSWQNFFKTQVARNLKSLAITNTHRFSTDSLVTLLENCGQNLESLSLTRLDGLNSKPVLDLLPHFLTNLKNLDLSSPHDENLIDDELIINLLAINSETLESIKLDGCSGLTDKFLIDGLKPFGSNLTAISLGELDQITDNGVSELFNDWSINSGLLEINLSRCIQLTDASILKALNHSRESLVELNLNSVNDITNTLFKKLSRSLELPLLTNWNLSFVRCVDDSTLAIISRICPSLSILEVYGNNKCTNNAITRNGLTIIGRQSD